LTEEKAYEAEVDTEVDTADYRQEISGQTFVVNVGPLRGTPGEFKVTVVVSGAPIH
jgi:hypothetical protein